MDYKSVSLQEPAEVSSAGLVLHGQLQRNGLQ